MRRLSCSVSVLIVLAVLASACKTPAPQATSTSTLQPTQVPTATPQPTITPTPVVITNPPTSPEMVDAIELKGKNIKVVYWHNRPQKDHELIQAMLAEFNKTNPYGIEARAEIAGIKYSDVYSRVNRAIQNGNPPDLSVAYPNQAAFYRVQNAVIDLTPFIQSKKYGLSQADEADYFPIFLASDANPHYQGERLGFPTQRSIEVMYYNADWLEQLGYDAPPTDWRAWQKIACQASQPAQKKYGWAFRHDASNFASQVFARGGRILAEDGSAYVFNSQAGIDTMTLILQMFLNRCAVEVPAAEPDGEIARFANGQVLFVFASSSNLARYKEAVSQAGKFNWNIAMLPQTGQPAVNLYGASVSVYRTVPERELAAWLVIKFLSEKAQTARWAIHTGYLPVRQSAKNQVIAAYKADPTWGAVADSYARLFDWLEYARIESPVIGYDEVRQLIDAELMSKVISNPSADVKKLLNETVAKANQRLAENKPRR